ncbi:flavin-containing amine oxidoreductase [Stachybotrys elegans]|uniref:Flavin-containing amine oxidoreductase n=1 Tax=Stachybotrys elegans TaxID=80388 RepID=A0A8K0SF61_9HYPO|nr:flavin-containing amine oxidoreductase [Stachybotrys elegans]
MKWLVASTLAAASLAQPVAGAVHIRTNVALHSRVANVHVDYDGPVQGRVAYTYGPCDAADEHSAAQVVARRDSPDQSHRLVWVIPKDAESGGCLSAWDGSGLLGRSTPQVFGERMYAKRATVRKRDAQGIPMTNETGFNVWGPWFDGVSLLESSNNSYVDVEAAKNKEIAIVGAGMSGLMTYLVLHQAGMKNLTIIEGSERLGGRVRTEYLSGGPEDYIYQEMGPMRIPQTTVVGNQTYNISDQAIFFSLVEELNRLNKDSNPERLVNLIPFIQYDNNALVYYQGRKMENGLPPTVGQVAADPSLGPPIIEYPESAIQLSNQLVASLPGQDFVNTLAQNIWQAHSDFLKDRGPAGLPGDQWSEFAFLVNYLNGSVTDANAITGGVGEHFMIGALYYAILFSPLGQMKTIDGGMNRLPNAFHPLVDGNVQYGQKIERIQFNETTKRLTLQSRSNYTEKEFHSKEYDYAIMATPFTVIQRMRLPQLDFVMRNAINSLAYSSACKVALEYRTRFWEHYDNPIYGSCATVTDIPGIGSICYPSYNLNGTGPAALLASYQTGAPGGVEWMGVPEEQHVQYVVDAMAEIHGQVAYDEYTGKYSRKCWDLDELSSGGWASPNVGSHETYMPEYFKTHSHMIFVGEHTSVTHAWIAAALESGIRGAVQLLLELGLVDEAKETVDKWMARWISVVCFFLL